MNILLILAPLSLALGLGAVAAFLWTLRAGQYEDARGAAERILIDDEDGPGACPDGGGGGPARRVAERTIPAAKPCARTISRRGRGPRRGRGAPSRSTGLP